MYHFDFVVWSLNRYIYLLTFTLLNTISLLQEKVVIYKYFTFKGDTSFLYFILTASMSQWPVWRNNGQNYGVNWYSRWGNVLIKTWWSHRNSNPRRSIQHTIWDGALTDQTMSALQLIINICYLVSDIKQPCFTYTHLWALTCGHWERRVPV